MKNQPNLVSYCLSLLTATAALIGAGGPLQAQEKRPNILIIWGDDIGQFNLSAYNLGMMGYRTPNIDRLAKEGALFTDWYGQQSCTAGRSPRHRYRRLKDNGARGSLSRKAREDDRSLSDKCETPGPQRPRGYSPVSTSLFRGDVRALGGNGAFHQQNKKGEHAPPSAAKTTKLSK